MAKTGVTVVVDNMSKLVEGVAFLAHHQVMVGIPDDKSQRKDPQQISNADLLYIHENGAPEAGIPARPTLRPGVESVQKETERRLALAGQAALDARPQSARAQFEAIGMINASAVKNRINSNTPPPLRPGTLAARRRRGVKRTNTLVDTGQMRNAVTYVVRKV